MDDLSRSIYMVPHDWAMKNSRHHKTSGNQRMLIANPDLEHFRNNFALNANPAPSGSLSVAAAEAIGAAESSVGEEKAAAIEV